MIARKFWWLILGVGIGIAINATFADTRLEAGVGRCQHSLAPDSSWHYDYGGYQEQMTLSPSCEQIGVLWKRGNWGARLAYVNLGFVDMDNTYPVDEPAYFKAKDTHTAVVSETARFQGSGNSRGMTLGPVYEHKLLGLDLSGEVGGALLYNTWHAMIGDGLPTWSHADGWNMTWYAGLGARWNWLFASVRRYENVHASQADKNYQYIGPTSGHVAQIIIGMSVPL